MNYSLYANDYLVSLHREYLEHLQRGDARANDHEMTLLGKLLDSTYSNYMNPVWEELRAKEPNDELVGEWYLDVCLKAIAWRAPELTPTLEENRLLSISKKSRELADLIEEQSIVSTLSTIAISSELDAILNPDWSRVGRVKFARPKLSKMLLRFAGELDEKSKIPPETKKPNAPTAHEMVFVRRLTASMSERFGDPLCSVVAHTANTVFNSDRISERFVRDNIRK